MSPNSERSVGFLRAPKRFFAKMGFGKCEVGVQPKVAC